MFVLTNNITVVRNDRLEKPEINGNLLVKDDLWFVAIVFHEILELSLIEIEIDTHKVVAPVFSSDTLFSSWKPEWMIKILFEDEYRTEELMKEEDFLDALDHILAGAYCSKVVNELVSELQFVGHGTEWCFI